MDRHRKDPGVPTAVASVPADFALTLGRAMMRMPPDDLLFTVERWDSRAQHVDETLARCANLLIARAAFDQAGRMYPDAVLLLSDRTRIVAEANWPA